jgi:hypothetical protein
MENMMGEDPMTEQMMHGEMSRNGEIVHTSMVHGDMMGGISDVDHGDMMGGNMTGGNMMDHRNMSHGDTQDGIMNSEASLHVGHSVTSESNGFCTGEGGMVMYDTNK